MSDDVFHKCLKPGDTFYLSIGKSSTTTSWQRPTYEKIHKTLTEIKNCTDIFERYEVYLLGKCLTNWKTKDCDMMIFPKGYTDVSIDFKDINLNLLENDFASIHDIGFKYRMLIDLSYSSKINYEPTEINYDYIINHPLFKKYEKDDINESMYSFLNNAFIEDTDLFMIRPSPIVKRINEQIGIRSARGIEISNFLRLRSFETETIRIAGIKNFTKILKNPTKSIVIKFDASEFLNISEEEFKERTNHNKDLII